MEKSQLKPILNEWTQMALKKKYIPRRTPLKNLLQSGFVTAIQGVRRCGKSTFLSQIIQESNLTQEQCVVANFEDPRLSGELQYPLLDTIFTLQTQTNPGVKQFFFFDEIQNVLGWQKWLNSKLELAPEHIFIITGSNSALLSGELATSLTGRHVQRELFPFDFLEYVTMFSHKTLLHYIKEGGFPGIMTRTEPTEILRQYFMDIVEKDIRERVGAKSSQNLILLGKLLCEAVGSELSARKVASLCGISHETTLHYLSVFEKSYLAISCPFFAYSEAQRIRHNRKYYLIDTGLRRSIATSAGADLGKDFENLVFLELKKITPFVFYWKGQGEVDFILQNGRQIIPIQVSLDTPKPRHEAALEEFYRRFPHAEDAIFVSLDSFLELQAELTRRGCSYI